VDLVFAEDEDAVVLRADAGFCLDGALLVTLLAALTGEAAVPPPRALEGVGGATAPEIADDKRRPLVLAACWVLVSSRRDSSLVAISSSLSSSLLEAAAAACLFEFFLTLRATPLRFGMVVFTLFERAAAGGSSPAES
jgi:hypothetical protein